jgi:hypothetical protein
VNIVEYALNLDPKAFNTNALPAASVSGGYPRLSYTAVESAVDINYVVEISTDLVTWRSGPPYLNPVQIVDNGATDTVTVSSPNTIAAQPSQFLRLRVTRQ